MELFYIILLILLGLLFLVAELLLLPGISVGGVLALVCGGVAGRVLPRGGGGCGSGWVSAISVCRAVASRSSSWCCSRCS